MNNILKYFNEQIKQKETEILNIQKQLLSYNEGNAYVFHSWCDDEFSPFMLTIGDVISSKYGEEITITEFKNFVNGKPRIIVGISTEDDNTIIEIGYDRIS